MLTKTRATVEDLYNAPGKAELINGELVEFMATGINPARSGGKIYASLLNHEEETGGGYALPDNAGLLVNLPNRKSFSPDAAWIAGETPDTMKFGNGAPTFAVEVRSENDYGLVAENDIADKIRDYFAAGTLVVWDVDLQSADAVVRKYLRDAPDHPTPFARDEEADAEPAVPGWRFPVSRLFR